MNHEDAPLRLGPPESNHRSLAATLRTNVPGREFELTVRALPPLPGGNLFGQIKLTTSSTNTPRIEIPVFALVQPDVVVTPNTLTLPAGALAEPLRHTVLIHSFWPNTLAVVGASVSDSTVAVRLTPVAPGRGCQLELMYPAGFRSPAPGQRIELRLETNHPRNRSFRVPIRVEATAP